MALIKKIDRAKALIKENEALFRCPMCTTPLVMNEGYRFVCDNNHNFDLAKKGYLNLLNKSSDELYSKDLFEARQLIVESGFYDPLIDRIFHCITNEMTTVLDAGCGEGSILRKIQEKANGRNHTFFGVDIAKDGIQIASRQEDPILWCIADLAHLPFKDRSLDVILNILSPANYVEFKRILDEEGLIIKVIPGANYLKELRETIYSNTEKETYSNKRVIEHFEANLKLMDLYHLDYQFPLTNELTQALIKMTPLTWGKISENGDQIYLPSISVEFDVLVGKYKNYKS